MTQFPRDASRVHGKRRSGARRRRRERRQRQTLMTVYLHIVLEGFLTLDVSK